MSVDIDSLSICLFKQKTAAAGERSGGGAQLL